MFLRKNPPKKKGFGGKYKNNEIYMELNSCCHLEVQADSLASKERNDGEHNDGEHVLIMFEDKKLSVVPMCNVIDEVVTINEMCTIRWSDGKKYKVEALFQGESSN